MSRPTPNPPRLKDEPPLWYARFKIWLHMPLPRSFLEIYNMERDAASKKRLESPPGSWRDVQRKYQWFERAEAWDNAESERISLELNEKREAQRARELKAAELLYTVGMENVNGPLFDLIKKKYDKDGKVIEEKEFRGNPSAVRVAITAIEVASDQARKALEMVDKRFNLSQATDAEIIRLLALANSRGTGSGSPEAGDTDTGAEDERASASDMAERIPKPRDGE